MLTTPRRVRHYASRASYVLLLFVLMWTAWQSIIGFRQVDRISDVANFHAILFELLAYTELVLVLFAAALYGTSSISHEKDRRTFILLLVTRLQDVEIVVNKFLCGLVQITTLLLVAVPVFLLAGLMGGVSFLQIAQMQAVMFGSAVLAGAVGVFIAVWREKTFQSVAMSLLVISLGLLGVEILADFAHRDGADQRLELLAHSLSPYRAVAAILRPDLDYAERMGLLNHPSWAFLFLSVGLGIGLLMTAAYKLRAWNPRGEPIQRPDEEQQKLDPAHRRDPFRHVWDNPVLWREIRTRAYGAKPILVKLAYGLVFALLIAGLYLAVGQDRGRSNDRMHQVLALYAVPICVLSLLLINAQAVSAVTSERDIKSLDLLLATDVTPKEFVFGKFIGVLFNTLEMLLGPIIMFILGCAWRLITPMSLGMTLIPYLVLVVFALVLGIHAALRYDSTKVALAHSLGTMFMLFVGILICLFLILISGRFEAQWLSFILFIFIGSIGLWVSLSADSPTSAITLTASILPFATFYCIVAFIVGDRSGPLLVFLVSGVAYGFAVLSLLVPLLSEFDVATGRTSAGEG